MAPNNNSDSNVPENPNEYLVIPKWINEDYFRPILEKEVDDFVSIKKFTVIAATQPGENFTSIMVRVIVDIETKDGCEKNICYILKTTLETDKGGDFVAGMSLFPKEKEMYQVQIPNYIKLYKEAGVDIELAPKCVHIEETPEGITLVMEDLKQQNFENIDRLKGFDMEHMTRVLRKVAELHAASVINHERNGQYADMFYLSLFNEKTRPIFEGMTAMRMVQYVEAMRQWNLPDVEEYIKLIPTPTKFFDNGVNLYQVNESEFNVLNHGDLWCNNIMFSGDRTLFVDLQMAKWGSPAQDLWYLITSSASLDIKIKEFDHFIQIYHTRLVECLKLLKYSKPIPTLRELHIMMIKHGDWAMSTANGVLVIVVLPSDKDANINTLLMPGPEGDAFRYKTFSNPRYEKAMVQLYPFFKNKGLL
ncbi:uncharacterized protein LOC132784852 [Drosophila nasuta]|uniref:uncharacterized protein LOC132784852 n=1 Tax=Drosophila nasuta TaxID=42062 RepID=UPI00295E5A11|nr:uncharacterized protein LOC132784852 [Drosophila nasuta]